MSNIAKVSYYGTIHIGDMAFDCAVLDDEGNTRVYIQKHLMRAIGLSFGRGSRERAFLANFAPKYLLEKKKTDVAQAAKLPHGGHAKIYEAGVLSEIASNIVDSLAEGTLHHQYRHLVKPCIQILRALAKTGEVALIDEATGYQYHREPDALQDLFTKLIRQSCATWERRFHPEYYESLFGLFGWTYESQPNKPSIIGAITLKWVYEIAFPPEILGEIKERQQSEKLHQWLTEQGGLPILEKQRDAVTTIAQSACDFPDFEARCMKVFNRPGQMGIVFPNQEVRA